MMILMNLLRLYMCRQNPILSTRNSLNADVAKNNQIPALENIVTSVPRFQKVIDMFTIHFSFQEFIDFETITMWSKSVSRCSFASTPLKPSVLS
jgi:hypothetical protein